MNYQGAQKGAVFQQAQTVSWTVDGPNLFFRDNDSLYCIGNP